MSRNLYVHLACLALALPLASDKVAPMMTESRRYSTTRGFSRASTLMQTRIRQAGETRGFAQARLLTHWHEIVGPAVAKVTRPVKVSFAHGGMGATLVLLTTGARAPMLEMQKQAIRDKVNSCYGYNAISRIQLTQTAPTGFAEGQAEFDPAPKPTDRSPDPATRQAARDIAAEIGDKDLRNALEALAAHVLSRPKR